MSDQQVDHERSRVKISASGHPELHAIVAVSATCLEAISYKDRVSRGRSPAFNCSSASTLVLVNTLSHVRAMLLLALGGLVLGCC